MLRSIVIYRWDDPLDKKNINHMLHSDSKFVSFHMVEDHRKRAYAQFGQTGTSTVSAQIFRILHSKKY